MDDAQTSTSDKATEDMSLGELVASATRDLSLLVRQEVGLAKAEIKKDVAAAGTGAGLFGAAGIAAALGLLLVSVSAAYGISWLGVPLGCAYFAVGALYLLAAAVLGLTGRKAIGEVGPPERTIGAVKDDLEWVKHPTRTS